MLRGWGTVVPGALVCALVLCATILGYAPVAQAQYDECTSVDCWDPASCNEECCGWCDSGCSMVDCSDPWSCDEGCCGWCPPDCSAVECSDTASCTEECCGTCDPCAGVDCGNPDSCFELCCGWCEETCDSVICSDPASCTEECCGTCDPCAEQVCDDGDSCNGEETCNPDTGECEAGEPLNCDDGDGCTVDSCDPSGSCYNEPIECDDYDYCTTDSCDSATGMCVWEPLECYDGDECTWDTCDPSYGCSYEEVWCDDGDDCTWDWCEAAYGCSYEYDWDTCGWEPEECTIDPDPVDYDYDVPGVNAELSVPFSGYFCKALIAAGLPSTGELTLQASAASAGSVMRDADCRSDIELSGSLTGHVQVCGPLVELEGEVEGTADVQQCKDCVSPPYYECTDIACANAALDVTAGADVGWNVNIPLGDASAGVGVECDLQGTIGSALTLGVEHTFTGPGDCLEGPCEDCTTADWDWQPRVKLKGSCQGAFGAAITGTATVQLGGSMKLTGREGQDCPDPPICVTGGVDASIDVHIDLGVNIGPFGGSITLWNWGCEGTYDKGTCEDQEDTGWECDAGFIDVIL